MSLCFCLLDFSVCADCFKDFVYFKTVQPKVGTLWSGKLEAEAVASSLIEGEKLLFLAGRSERGPNS